MRKNKEKNIDGDMPFVPFVKEPKPGAFIKIYDGGRTIGYGIAKKICRVQSKYVLDGNTVAFIKEVVVVTSSPLTEKDKTPNFYLNSSDVIIERE